MKLLFSRDIYVCACSVGKCVYACHFLAEKLLACCPEKVTELTLCLSSWFFFLLLPMQTSLKVSFSLMTVSCANWMKMSASAAVRLQSVVCSCTNHHQYSVCVPLRAQDWVDPLSHQMIRDTSKISMPLHWPLKSTLGPTSSYQFCVKRKLIVL